MKNHHGGVILLGDHVYGANDPGILTCMDLKTGKVAWSDRELGKGSIVDRRRPASTSATSSRPAR